LSINREGNLNIERDATLQGNLTVAGGHIEFEAGTARLEAQPWSIYHVEDAGTGKHELRVEIARAPTGGVLGNNQLVIGAWFKGSNDEEEFQPCLTIDDNCKVTVYGNLVVLGQLTETNAKTQPIISNEARGFIAGGFMSGISGTSSLFPRSAGNADAPQPPNLFDALKMNVEANTDALLLALEADPDRFADFAKNVKTNHPVLAEKLRAALGDIIEP
jgi:hypothetical protein